MSIRDYMRKAPSGEYIVVVPIKFREEILRRFGDKVSLEEYGNELIVKTRSRAILKELVKYASTKM